MEFTDLMLLIGTNPLPNYVVAKHFLENIPHLQRIWLVHSENNISQAGTNIQAKNLERVLEDEYKATKAGLFPLGKVALSDVSNAKTIFNDVKDKLISQLLPGNSVHLNYTGGTKVMGIHVYQAIKQEDTKNLSRSYSYLDGRNFQIVDDDGTIIANDLRDKISIGFEALIKVHGFIRINEKSDINFTPAIGVYRTLINEGRLNEYDSKTGGYNRTFFEDKDKPGDRARQVSKLKMDELKAFKPNDAFLSIVNAMPEKYRLFNKGGQFVPPATNNQCERAIKLLDGGWFEEYIYTIFENAFGSFYAIDKNWEIKKETWHTTFELDVIMLRGYQLIGVSCTTSAHKDTCKNKGFEIIHRTTQIGGDEAKAIIVTGLDSAKNNNLQEELTLETGSTSSNILALGKDDWKEEILKSEINRFLEGQET